MDWRAIRSSAPTMLTALASFAMVALLTSEFPQVAAVHGLPPVVRGIGTVMLFSGVFVYPVVATYVRQRPDGDPSQNGKLDAFRRHPLFATFALLVVPGLTLISGIWPFVVADLVTFLVFWMTHED